MFMNIITFLPFHLINGRKIIHNDLHKHMIEKADPSTWMF